MLPRKENIIIAKSDVYSNRILKLYQYLTDVKHEFVISKQIVRSGTSIGANIAESRNAQGTKDFISKLNIALKEADETEFGLRSCYTESISPQFNMNLCTKTTTRLSRFLRR